MKRESWVWLVPWLGGGAAGWFEVPLVDLVGDARAFGIYAFVGVVLGWAWYRLYPRQLAARLLGLVMLGLVLALFVVVGGDADGNALSPNDAIGLGVLAGLVLTETRRSGGEWAHQRRTRMSSRETMRELR
jgi:hypothetical protein